MAPDGDTGFGTARSGAAVWCRNVSKVFDAGGDPVPAVGPLDVDIAAGTTTALVGPSGCGKSTLLRMIAGLEIPTDGDIRIGTETPTELTARAGLAMAFQDASLLPWRTVRGNVALALTLARRPADPDRIDALLDLVGLAGFGDRRPGELSGGMRQRAAIARCLVGDPGLLLLDEPFGAVDELTRRRLGRDLAALWHGRTTLLVTHSVTEAALIADRILVLSPRPGIVVADIAVPQGAGRDGPRDETAPDIRACIEAVTDALAASAPDRLRAAQ